MFILSYDKNHTRERCYKLIGYPVNCHFHPSNKGKKRPFNRNEQHGSGQTATANSKALKASIDHSDSQNSPKVATQMEALQNQMNTLLKFSNSGSVKPSSSSS